MVIPPLTWHDDRRVVVGLSHKLVVGVTLHM